MKQNQFWLSLVALCVAVACAAAIVLAIVSATTALALTTPEEPSPIVAAQASPMTPAEDTSLRQRTIKGVVTDTSCSARHLNEDKTAAECARICVEHGAHYALASGERVYVLDGKLAEVDQLAGQRAEVVGSVEGDLITVRSIRVAE